MFQLMQLPYSFSALEPYISTETVEYHYAKHHQTYINNLNNLIENTDYAKLKLEEIVRHSTGAIFNNAAQVWNHDFYWHCIDSVQHASEISTDLAILINQEFGSFVNFQAEFTKTALATFGSGWAWLVKTVDNKLKIVSTSNAATILTSNDKPLLTCDVWEHAYYIDYRNSRANYLAAFWKLVNWHAVNIRFRA